MKLKLRAVYKDHKHAFFPMFSKVAMVMSATPSFLGLGKQMSGAAAERVIVREDELNPTQEMNAIMKHNVRRANPVDAICPLSLERWLETPKKGERLITSSLFRVGFLFKSITNWWMELFCITAVICFFSLGSI